MKSSLYTKSIRVKVDNDFGGIEISHEESICILRDNGRVYFRGTGTRIYVGVWVQRCLPLFGVDYLNFV